MDLERLESKIQFGWLSLNRGDFAQAKSTAGEVLKEQPDSPEALLLLGLAALDEPDEKTAEVATRQLLHVEPNDSRSQLLLGFFSHQVAKDSVAAEKAFRDALRLDPEDPDIYAILGQFLGSRRRYQEGIATTRKGLKVDPDNLLVVQALQTLYRLADDTEMADQFGRRALQLDPEASVNHLEAGFRMLESKGTGSEAKGDFLEALRLAPTDSDSKESIAHEKVRTHPLFKNGIILPINKTSVIGAIATPFVWFGLSLLWRPIVWLALLSAVVVLGLFAYTGLFYLCRRVVLNRLRSGKL